MTAPNNGGGSFARAGAATPRGLVVIAVAVIVGVLVMNGISSGSDTSTGGTAATTTTTTTSGDTTTTAATGDTEATTTTAATGDSGATTTTGAVVGGTTDSSVPPPGCRPHADVKVQAANGARVGGVAASVTQTLLAEGFQTGTATNLEGTEQLAETKIYYQEGWLCEAQEVAAILGITDPQRLLDMPTDPPVDQYEGANVLVAIGLDLVGE